MTLPNFAGRDRTALAVNPADQLSPFAIAGRFGEHRVDAFGFTTKPARQRDARFNGPLFFAVRILAMFSGVQGEWERTAD